MPESSQRERSDDKEEPAPEAFDPSLDEAQVLKAVELFIA
jgi:hypothetical protein